MRIRLLAVVVGLGMGVCASRGAAPPCAATRVGDAGATREEENPFLDARISHAPLCDYVSHRWCDGYVPANLCGLYGRDERDLGYWFNGSERPKPAEDLPVLPRNTAATVTVHCRRIRLHLSRPGLDTGETTIVELWVTRDGRYWHRHHQQFAGTSLGADLPADGRYGLRVIAAGPGLSTRRPKAGDVPQVWVEVNQYLPAFHTGQEVVDGGKVFLRFPGENLPPVAPNECFAGIIRVDAEQEGTAPPRFRDQSFVF